MDEADLRSRVARLSLEQKVRLLTGAGFWALQEEPDAGLRRVVTSDGPAGVRGETWDERDTSANVPSPTALAATWDASAPGALGHLRPAAARAPWLLRPDRSGTGTEIRFFSADGALLGTEQRGGAVFRWMSGFGAAGAPEQVARLEVSCVVRATEAGVYQLGVSGLGRFRLLADGTELFDATLTMREGADFGEALMIPPQKLAPIELAAGQSVAVLLEHDLHSATSPARQVPAAGQQEPQDQPADVGRPG
jgi:hypothetical protein